MDPKKCIIHSESFISDQHLNTLIAPKDIQSWKSLLKAAELRCHEPLLELAKTVSGNDIPDIVYHRFCRRVFNMKRDLDAIKLGGEISEEVRTPEKKVCTQGHHLFLILI